MRGHEVEIEAIVECENYSKCQVCSWHFAVPVRFLVTMGSQAILSYNIHKEKLFKLLDQIYGKDRYIVKVSIISSSKDTANGSAKLWQLTCRLTDVR